MGTSTTVHIGCYLVCTMSVQQVDVETHVCSHNGRHKVSESDRFCSKCGHAVVRQVSQQPTYQTIDDFFNGEVIAPESDLEFLHEAFSFVPSEWVGFNAEDKEIVLFDRSVVSIDGDCDGVHEIDWFETPTRPTDDEIERLMSIVGYTDVQVKFGALVSIA